MLFMVGAIALVCLVLLKEEIKSALESGIRADFGIFELFLPFWAIVLLAAALWAAWIY